MSEKKKVTKTVDFCPFCEKKATITKTETKDDIIYKCSECGVEYVNTGDYKGNWIRK